MPELFPSHDSLLHGLWRLYKAKSPTLDVKFQAKNGGVSAHSVLLVRPPRHFEMNERILGVYAGGCASFWCVNRMWVRKYVRCNISSPFTSDDNSNFDLFLLFILTLILLGNSHIHINILEEQWNNAIKSCHFLAILFSSSMLVNNSKNFPRQE